MEFINQQISFTERVVRKAIPSAIIKVLIISAVGLATNSFAKDNIDTIMILLGIALFAMIIFEFVRDYKDCVNWIELLVINENKQTCTLRLFQKNDLYKELELPVSAITCKQRISSRGRSGDRHFLEIYSNNELVFELSDAIISRYKLQKISTYFNNETADR